MIKNGCKKSIWEWEIYNPPKTPLYPPLSLALGFNCRSDFKIVQK